ncbi:MAG: class I SAM-dependent methyltransferase [Bacteriovorax sp.]|nr:class I SAM-dependent methyltransferase [Bacteriovorax sp.]
MARHIFGKELDVTKLKSNVLSDLNKHIGKIHFMMDELKNIGKIVTQPKCFICNSTKSSHFSNVYGFEYVECSDCSHVYTQTRYRDEDIIEFYTENATYSQVTYANKETCNYRRDCVAKPKFDFVIDNISGIPSTKKWLDVGCGIGDLVSVANDSGWDCTGLELSRHSIAFSKEIFNQNLVQSTLEDHAAKSNDRYDIISFIGVLEHVINPIKHLEITHELLGQDGYVLIQVPNALSMSTFTQDIFPNTVFRHMSPVEHIMLFSQTSLEKALTLTGFEPVVYWWHGLDSYEILNQITLLSKEEIHNTKFNNAWMKLMSEIQLVFDNNKLSDRILCLAKKI